MSLIAVSPMWLPQVQVYSNATPTFQNTLLIDASGEKAAAIVKVPKTGTLDKFEFRLGAVTQAPTNGLRCAFQDVDLATGDPDGTDDQFRVVTTGLTANTWLAPGLLTSDGTDTGTKRSVTRGDLLACVVGFDSFLAGDSLVVCDSLGSTGSPGALHHFPYMDHFTASWSKQQTRDIGVVLRYSDGTYAYAGGNVSVASTATARAFANSSTPDERGVRFTVAAPMAIGGAWVRISGGGDWDLVLYDNNDTVLASVSNDKDVDTSGANSGGHFVWFGSDVALAANTVYRLVVKPTSVTTVTVYDFTVNSNAILGALETGTTWYHTERTDAGAWTDTNTIIDSMGLLVTQVHDGSGQGGFALVPTIFGLRWVMAWLSALLVRWLWSEN